jgi:hypothetical protein
MTRRVLFARIVTALVAVPLAGVIKPPSRVFAAGGPVTTGGLYMAGEGAGCEIFIPEHHGIVIAGFNRIPSPDVTPIVAALGRIDEAGS